MILSLCLNPSVDTFLWLDRLEAKGANRILKEQRYPGGKGVHVALAVAELGEESSLVSLWGGESGAWIRRECESMGVKCFGPSVQEWARSCWTLKTKDTFDETEVLGLGPEASESSWREIQAVTEKQASEAKVICLSGSLPRGLNTEAYAMLIRHSNRPVLLDCTGPAFEQALKAKPFGLHLNRAEAHALGFDSPMVAAEKLSEQLPLVAITAGREGLFLGYENQVLHGHIELDKVESAVGSGDCLVAGLAVALSRELPPEDLARYGVAAGAANCLRPELGMLNRRDVERLLPQVKVRSAT